LAALAGAIWWCGRAAADVPTPPPTKAHPPVKSEPPPIPPGPVTVTPPQLTYDLRIDVPLVVLGYVTWSTLQALDNKLDPSRCHWCDDELNALDRETRNALMWPEEHQETALVLSDISANALAPAATVGVSATIAAYDDRFAEVPIDIVVTGEAVALAGIVTQIVKFSTGRMRPETRALPPEERPSGEPNDAYVSFYSGHTSYAFSLATSAGTIASMRRYRGAEWVWVSGLTVAAATGYFRIASDKHYLTDVLAGGAAASAIGFLVPFVFHRPRQYLVPLRPGMTPLEDGALFTVDVDGVL
jgi:membrane-associated phospholipid phosphatase